MGRRTQVFVLGLALAGCNGGGGDCTALADGEWTFDGAAIGMLMGGSIQMDVAACSFEISEWSMAMSHLPSGGEVVGDEITLSGEEAYWTSCTGKVEREGTAASGVCADDDAEFTMAEGAAEQ
jgi:hypothetical protein